MRDLGQGRRSWPQPRPLDREDDLIFHDRMTADSTDVVSFADQSPPGEGTATDAWADSFGRRRIRSARAAYGRRILSHLFGRPGGRPAGWTDPQQQEQT
jgi:hypothetical protein